MMDESPDERRRRLGREKSDRWRRTNLDKVRANKARYRSNPDVKTKEQAAFKAWSADNRDRLNAKRRMRFATDSAYRAKVLAATSARQKANRAAVNAGRRDRLKADPAYRMSYLMGNALRRALRGKAGQSWHKLMGYTAADLVAHLARQFEPWMTWENYGTAWHVDHRRPVASFDLPLDVALCWSLDNLRPLAGFENMSKGAKVFDHVIPDHLKVRADRC